MVRSRLKYTPSKSSNHSEKKNKTQENDQEKEKGGVIQNFKRSLSRKEKNKEKKKNKAAEGSEDETG